MCLLVLVVQGKCNTRIPGTCWDGRLAWERPEVGTVVGTKVGTDDRELDGILVGINVGMLVGTGVGTRGVRDSRFEPVNRSPRECQWRCWPHRWHS